VVIAMWKPIEALGWEKKPIGWWNILALARNQKGWAAYGYPQWGSFKFGHTHPQFSNSGLISLFAEVYAASGKTAGITTSDLNKPHTAAFLAGIEKSVVHYGSSTGFFGRQMFSSGPQYLSAAVLYENMGHRVALPEQSSFSPSRDLSKGGNLLERSPHRHRGTRDTDCDRFDRRRWYQP
jgi:Ca-activated chloride channel homolog